MAITVFAKLVLEALQRVPGASVDEVVATVRGWRDLIRDVAAAPTAPEALSALWTYVLDTAPLPAERVIEVVDEVMEAETTMKRMTAGAWLRAEGRAEGKAEGKAEGIAEGLLEAHARLLRRLPAERFGRVPRHRDRLIRSASLEQLEQWAVRTLSASTLDAVFE